MGDDVVELAGDPRPLLHDHLVALGLGHGVAGCVALGDRLAPLPPRVAQDLCRDHEHEEHDARERVLVRPGDRGDEERRRQEHRPAPPVAVGHEVDDDELRGDAGQGQERRVARDRDERGERDDARDPGRRVRQKTSGSVASRLAIRPLARSPGSAAYRSVSTMAPSPSARARAIGPSGPDRIRRTSRRDRRRSRSRGSLSPRLARGASPWATIFALPPGGEAAHALHRDGGLVVRAAKCER